MDSEAQGQSWDLKEKPKYEQGVKPQCLSGGEWRGEEKGHAICAGRDLLPHYEEGGFCQMLEGIPKVLRKVLFAAREKQEGKSYGF